MRLPRDLKRVEKELLRLRRRESPAPDLKGAQEDIRLLVRSMVADGYHDDEIVAAVDAHVDSLSTGWIADSHRAHMSVMSRLDTLQIPVEQALVRTGTLDHNEELKLRDYNGAAENVIDQLIDPDTPYFDPLPRQLTKE